MSGRRAKRERRLARAQQAAKVKPTPVVQAPVAQRYEVLHYRGDVTMSDRAQPGALLGHDEMGRPYEVLDAEYIAPATVLAEGHFDGDGCTFPTPGHFLPGRTTVQLQYATPDNIRAAMVAAGIAS